MKFYETPTPQVPKLQLGNLLALRAGTEAGWVLAYALVFSEFLFFRYLNQ